MKSDDVYEFTDKNKDDDYNEPEVEEILGDDEILRKDNIKDVIFTNDIECILNNQIYIKKLKLFANELTYLKRLASFTNPEFYEKQRIRLPIYKTPRIITCFEEDERFLKLPRGCIGKIKEICNISKVKLIIKDMREKGTQTDYEFNGKLNKKQEKAMKKLLEYDVGVLCAPTGFGKTVVGAKIISELKTNTLVIVNRNNLLEQWREKLSYFLNINKKEIGQIGASKEKINGKLDVASFQSLFKKDNLEELVKGYGLVIVDECQGHLPGRQKRQSGRVTVFLEANNEEKLLSFYNTNRFVQFDTRLTASDPENQHELIQLLRNCRKIKCTI